MERHKLTYDISLLRDYINWPYFYHAWQLKNADKQMEIKEEAMRMLDSLEGRYHVYALFALGDANSDGDDIVFEGVRLPMLRQQHSTVAGEPNLCMADFIRPLAHGIADRMGVFCTTVDIGLEKDFDGDAYKKMMVQLIADRLAEAAAERMHEEVRKTYWGYAHDENLTISDMHVEKFQGIRPAVGYPSLPDTSMNFVLDGIIHFADVGIRLTESGAMKPHASVSGLMISHPKARYFMLGKIGADQVEDYARRRGVPIELMRRFLAGVTE